MQFHLDIRVDKLVDIRKHCDLVILEFTTNNVNRLVEIRRAEVCASNDCIGDTYLVMMGRPGEIRGIYKYIQGRIVVTTELPLGTRLVPEGYVPRDAISPRIHLYGFSGGMTLQSFEGDTMRLIQASAMHLPLHL